MLNFLVNFLFVLISIIFILLNFLTLYNYGDIAYKETGFLLGGGGGGGETNGKDCSSVCKHVHTCISVHAI